MDTTHPIDAEIRRWLKAHVPNESDLSLKIGRSGSWLHKYVNGSGHATIDDLVRVAAHLMGVNMPVLTGMERKLLDAFQELNEQGQMETLEYVEHRQRLARRARSKESSAPESHTPPGKVRKARGTP